MIRACLLALLLGVLALGPTLVPGRGLLPQDVLAFEPFSGTLDASERSALEDASVPHRRDKLLQFLPFDRAVGAAWRAGTVPLWSHDVFCGVPLLAETTSRALYPTAPWFALFPPQAVYAWTYLAHLVLAGAFAHRLVSRLGGTRAGADLAVTATVLSGYALAHCHHPMIYFAAVWCLPALDATLALLAPRAEGERGARRGPSVQLALSVALSWFAGFSQASVLLAWLVVAATAASLARELLATRRLDPRRGLRVAVPFLAGTLLALPQILPSLEASTVSSRRAGTPEELERAALPACYLLELVLPGQLAPEGDIVIGGEGPKPSYLAGWLTPNDRIGELSAGRYNATETAMAIGIWPLLFAILALATRRRRTTWFLWGTALFGLAAALALPGVFWIATHLPGFALGDLKRLLWLPSLALPLLAGLGATSWRGWSARIPFLVLGAALCGFALVLARTEIEPFERFFAGRFDAKFGAGIGDGFLRHATDPESAWNRDHLAAGLGRLGLALVVGVLLDAWGRTRALAWIAATAIELLPIAWNTTPAPRLDGFERPLPIPSAPADAPRPRLLRVEPGAPSVASVRLLPANLATLWGAAEVTGYVPLPARRSEAFFEAIEPDSTSRGAGLSALRELASVSSPWLPLLAPDVLAVLGEPRELPGWVPVERLGNATFHRPEAPFPRARLYFEHRVVPALDDAAHLVRAPAAGERALDPLRTLLLEEEPAFAAAEGARGEVHAVHAAHGVIRVRYTATGAAQLLVSEAWAPGWHVSIDGEAQGRETRPGQLMFQTTSVPAGEHVLELRYAPRAFRLGLWGALAGLVLLSAWTCVARRAA